MDCCSGVVLDLDGNFVSGEKMDEDLVVGGVPALAPVVHDEFAVEPDLNAAVGVGLKLVVAGDGREDGALPSLRA